MDRTLSIERSIITTYRKSIWARFIDAVKQYRLIEEGDRIAVCISGGKDSFLMAKCFQELLIHGKANFSLQFIVMNPGYRTENLQLIQENAAALSVPILVFDSPIFDVVTSVEKSPCYLCARMRRGYLYEKAKEQGCNKIALGHHFDDVVETTLLSMLYGAELKTMMPKLKSTSHPGMELIRPMYLIHEEDIIAWTKYNGLRFLNCACRFTEDVQHNREDSKRKEMKELIKCIKAKNPDADRNIFRAMHNVCLDAVVGYKLRGEKHSFLDEY